MACTLNGSFKKRAGYSLLNCLNSLVITLSLTNTNMSDTLIDHNSLDISKVKIDQTRNIDKVSNTLNCLLKDFICFLKSIRHSGTAVYDLKKTVIWDNDQSIYSLL